MNAGNKKIVLLKGGISAEREVSLRTGAAVAAALSSLQYKVSEIDVTARDFKIEAGALAVYICLHGTFGEDGELQSRLEREGLNFTGSGSRACQNAFDKLKTKRLFHEHGVPTPRGGPWKPGEHCPIPCVLKPVSEGSSVGVSIVRLESELAPAVAASARLDKPMMAEELVEGREVTVGILGDRALPLVEIRPHSGFFDYRNKYTAGMTEHICPAVFDENTTLAAQEAALAAHAALGCRVYSRVDVIIKPDGSPVVLEVNTIPGMTEISLLPEAARAAGIGFAQLCEKILNLSLEERP
ncbi:MAG: D-alanine--D-alanine ligase [Methylacidiphilales bacterium]|nr:D-alanine--D-alanine ligase [Candidatus Methylacidiphilales bacterium]